MTPLQLTVRGLQELETWAMRLLELTGSVLQELEIAHV